MTPRVDRPLNLLADEIKGAAARRTLSCGERGDPATFAERVPEETEKAPEVEAGGRARFGLV